MPQEIAITELKPHPRNELIYGQEENVSDLITLIEEAGSILVPLVINDKNIILSGHRRWLAAKKLNFKTVPCEVRTFESPEDELEFLLISNVSRMKTREQKAREGIVLEEVLSARSADRRRAKLKQFQSVRDESSLTDEVGANSSDEAVQGRTRDEVAKALKIGSGKQFDRMKAVIKKADELKEQGKDEDAELFLTVLNRSASAAHALMEVPLESLTDEDRENIKTGKVAPRVFLSESNPDKPKRKTPYKKVMEEIDTVNKAVRAMKKPLTRIEDDGEQNDIRYSISDIIINLSNYAKHIRYDEYDVLIRTSGELDLAINSFKKYLPNSLTVEGLEECKVYAESTMESLQELLSDIKSELEKQQASTKDNKEQEEA